MKDLSSKNRTKPKNLVQTAERASSILDILGKYSQGISVGELSEKLGFPKEPSPAYFNCAGKDFKSKKYGSGSKLMALGNDEFRTQVNAMIIGTVFNRL